MTEENKRERPSFYAIIPAFVRYNKALSPNARLLYGEITCLADKKGYCYASNSYFASVYGVGKSSITNWIKNLVEEGCIRQEFIYAKNKPVITERRLYLLPKPGQEEMANDLQDNGGGQIIDQGGQNSDHGVVKFLNGGGQIFGEELLQANNTRSSSSSDPPEEEAEKDFEKEFKDIETFNDALKSLDEGNGIKNDLSGDALDLKRCLKQLNRSFIFDEAFYRKALEFISSNSLDPGYFEWLYEFCKKRKPDKIDGYFYKVFFEPRCVELYKELSRPPPVKTIRCPVCGFEHNEKDLLCPQCHISVNDLHNPEKIEFEKQFYAIPENDKIAYQTEFEKLIEETSLEDFTGRR